LRLDSSLNNTGGYPHIVNVRDKSCSLLNNPDPIQVAVDIIVESLDQVLELFLGEVAIAAVDGLELGAIDGDQVTAEKIELAAEEGELPANVADCLAIVLVEIGDDLEIGRKAPEQPHHLHIAMGFALKHPAGAHPVEVAIEVELEQIGGMVRWASRFMERGMAKAELMQTGLFTQTRAEADRRFNRIYPD